MAQRERERDTRSGGEHRPQPPPEFESKVHDSLAGIKRMRYTGANSDFLMKIIVLLFVAFILASLFSALYFLLKDKGKSERMVKALTVRVALSVLLFALLMLGFYSGLITGKL
jgi:succinate dehydrogenase/fumarate reductase cytochrome b subunit